MFKKVVFRANHFRSSEHKGLTDPMYRTVLCGAEGNLSLPPSLEKWNGQAPGEHSTFGKAGSLRGLADSPA